MRALSGKTLSAILSVISVLAVSACSSIKMPNMDFIKIPDFRKEFSKDAENIGDYPDIAKAPQKPGDIRSDSDWDKAARDIMALKGKFPPPEAKGPNKGSDAAAIEAKIKRLSDKVEEYKLDDPQ